MGLALWVFSRTMASADQESSPMLVDLDPVMTEAALLSPESPSPSPPPPPPPLLFSPLTEDGPDASCKKGVGGKKGSDLSLQVVHCASAPTWIDTRSKKNSILKPSVLPWLADNLFEGYVKKLGPRGLWNLQQQCQGVDQQHRLAVKQTIFRLAKEVKWFNFLDSFLAQYSVHATSFPYEIFELGLGHRIMLNQLTLSDEARVYNLVGNMSESSMQEANILPAIQTNPSSEMFDYLYENRDFFLYEENYRPKKLSRRSMLPYSKRTMYFLKLELGIGSLRQNRYAEAWSHLLSALDHCEPGFPLMSRMMDNLAICSSILHLPLAITLHAVKQSLDLGKTFDDSWGSWMAFSVMCRFHGFYELSMKVYIDVISEIPRDCYSSYWLRRNHLECMMAQIEDNIMYQYCRSTFHKDCMLDCNKPYLFQYTVPHVHHIVELLEPMIITMKTRPEKNFYWAMYYYYRAILSIGYEADSADNESLQYMTMARSLFQASIEGLGEDDMRRNFAINLKKLLEPEPYRYSISISEFDLSVKMPFCIDKSDFLYRVAIFVAYWQFKFPSISMRRLMAKTIENYTKSTNNQSYRLPLAKCVLRVCETTFRHNSDNYDIQDYPRAEDTIHHNSIRKLLKRHAENFWDEEFSKPGIKHKPTPPKRLKILSSSKEFLNMYPEAQKMFAFGYHTVAWRTNK